MNKNHAPQSWFFACAGSYYVSFQVYVYMNGNFKYRVFQKRIGKQKVILKASLCK